LVKTTVQVNILNGNYSSSIINNQMVVPSDR
jgi:hypothetical protein